MKKYFSSPILVAFIILMGLIVRLYDLDGESIWTDEGHAIYVSSLDIGELIEENSRDNHPPLYSLILHYWMKLGPNTAYYLRLLSVIFGVLAIFLIYKVGEDLLDKNTGLISAFFLSLSVFHIHFSQEVRSYALVVVLILLSFFLFIRLIKNPKPNYLILYIVVSSLLVYTHFLGWFVFLTQNIFYILQFPVKKNRFKHVFIVDVIVLILYLPWLKVMISRIFSMQEEFWVLLPTWISIPQTFLIYAGTYTFFGICLLLIFSFLCLNSLLSFSDHKFKIRRSDRESKYLLLTWLWIPILAPFSLSFIITPFFISRITIGASLAFYLLSAIGLKKIPNKTLRTGLLVIILLFSLSNLGIYYNETNKEQWKKATEFVESTAESGDLLIFHAGFGLDKGFNFYAKREDLVKQSFPGIGLEVNQKNIKEITSVLEDHTRVWLILSHSRDIENLIIKNIEEQFNLVQHKEFVSFGINSHRPFVGIEIFHYNR
jgi:uncharacterized membrane protein